MILFPSCFKVLISSCVSLNNEVQEQWWFPIWVMTLGVQMTHLVKLISCGLVNFVLYAIVNLGGGGERVFGDRGY